MHTDLKVGMYWGEMGVDLWDADMWKQQVEKYEVRVLIYIYIYICNLRVQLIFHITLSRSCFITQHIWTLSHIFNFKILFFLFDLIYFMFPIFIFRLL